MSEGSSPENPKAAAQGASESKSPQPKAASSMLRSSSMVSVLTMLSRVLGLVRDVIMAQYFGARIDAFLIAFKIPNFFRRLFAEGAFTVSFVPVLSEYKVKRSFDEVQLLVSRVSGVLGAALMLLTVLAILFADYLPWLFAPGFRQDPEKFALTGELLRITFPYLMFIAMTAFAGSVMNAYGRFAVPAFTPVLLNICMILTTLYATPFFEEPLFALAWGVFFAGLVQLLFQLPFLARMRLLVVPMVNRKDEGVKRILGLMAPALFGISVSQINLLLDTVLASFLENGSVSWLYYADRLNNLPLGVFAIAIGVVVLPALSSRHAQAETDGFARTLDWGIRMVLLIALPASLALGLLAEPLMATIFFYGEVTAHDVTNMALALQSYSSGLVAFMLIKVLGPGYYARQDTMGPVKIGMQAMVVNMVFNLILVFPFQHVGLALATSISSWYNALMLYRGLSQQGVAKAQSGWLGFLAKMLVANAVLVGAIFWLAGDSSAWIQWQGSERVWHMAVVVVVGVMGYLLALLAAGLRVKHLKGEAF